MRLTCPCCGASASIEAWMNDTAWRQFAECLVREVPSMLQVRVLPYLGLFRALPRAGGGVTHGLSPTRALRILKDLAALVGKSTIRWKHGEERPASVQLWAAALDATLAARPTELTDHHYLVSVAYDMARGGAVAAEHRRETDRQGVRVRDDEEQDPVGGAAFPACRQPGKAVPQDAKAQREAHPHPGPLPEGEGEPGAASDEERAEVHKMLKRFTGKLGGE